MAATLVRHHRSHCALLTVVNDAFGYIALQNKIDPETLVLNYHKDRMLAMPGTRNSEDDAELVAGIAPRDQAIGFLATAFTSRRRTTSKLVSVGGQTPSAESVASGEYPLARPLFVYSSEVIFREKPKLRHSWVITCKTRPPWLASRYFPADDAITAANLETCSAPPG